MYILDTDTFTLFNYGHPKIREQTARKGPFVISIITKIEIVRDRFDFLLKASSKAEWLKAQSLLDEWEAKIAATVVAGVNEEAGDEFERLSKIKSLRKIGRADLLIACITLARAGTLVTRNVRDFKLVPGVKYENWAD